MNRKPWMLGALLIGLGLGTAATLSAGGAAESAAQNTDTKRAWKEKAEYGKKDDSRNWEAEHRKKRIQQVQQEIKEYEKRIADYEAKKTGGEEDALIRKKLELFTQQIIALKQVQVALENGDFTKAKALEEQRYDASTDWACEEFTANRDAEKAKLSALLADNPSLETKAAYGEWDLLSQQVLAKMRQKTELEKEVRRLKSQLEDARAKIRRQTCAEKAPAQP